MPYKFETNKIKLKPEQRKTLKIRPEQYEDVRLHYAHSKSQRKTAVHFGVSRRLITYILDPEKLKRQKELFRERQKDGRYYDKEKHTKNVREYRRRKSSILTYPHPNN